MSSTSSAEIIGVYKRHLSRGRARLAEMTGGAMEVLSHRAMVYDADGTEYLDCGGYGVFLLGHRHPAVTQAVIDQVQRHPMSTRLLLEPTAAAAASALASVTPAGMDRVHFVNSGAEATEAAIKLARANGKTNLISMVGGYHGKTMGALTLTAKELYQRSFRPLLPGVKHVPFGDVDALAVALRNGRDHCVVVEPVQAEGGVIVPRAGYLREVERLCREHNALFVLDEIQTGLGRLGHWWGADRDNVTPDIMLVGKNLSGGVIPVAAIAATDQAYRPFNRDPFVHSSTFAASPVAMAAAAAAVRTIEDEGLVPAAQRLGEQILFGINRILADTCPHLVTDVRGAGLLIGVELRDEQIAGNLTLELLERHILVNHSLNAHRVVRLTPPAVLTESDVAQLLEAFAGAASALAQLHPETTTHLKGAINHEAC
ncbi:aspartate aminotransferase family protein [Saccharopolyspora shandongensis]|uniref:aspartate aminotransferase family protein n=1 Tax=Saccharopolyspora shandongensis TaxID=418495 RepID=UPI0034015BAE